MLGVNINDPKHLLPARSGAYSSSRNTASLVISQITGRNECHPTLITRQVTGRNKHSLDRKPTSMSKDDIFNNYITCSQVLGIVSLN